MPQFSLVQPENLLTTLCLSHLGLFLPTFLVYLGHNFFNISDDDDDDDDEDDDDDDYYYYYYYYYYL
jgi:hypothetical protein